MFDIVLFHDAVNLLSVLGASLIGLGIVMVGLSKDQDMCGDQEKRDSVLRFS